MESEEESSFKGVNTQATPLALFCLPSLPPFLPLPLPRLAEMKTRGRTSCLLVERHAKTTWQTDDAFFLLIFSASPVLSKCSPAWQRNTLRLPLSPRPQKHPYRAPAKEVRGPFTSARSTLWNPLDSKGLWTSSSSCKAVSLNRTNHGWRVFPLFIHITARCDLIPTSGYYQHSFEDVGSEGSFVLLSGKCWW